MELYDTTEAIQPDATIRRGLPKIGKESLVLMASLFRDVSVAARRSGRHSQTGKDNLSLRE